MQRITLIDNRNWTKKTIFTIQLNSDNFIDKCFKEAKNKLRINNASTLYNENGNVITNQNDNISMSLYVAQFEENFNGILKDININTKTKTKITVLAEKSIISKHAIDQLNNISRLSDVISIVGMPDLHEGGQFPIGCVVCTSKTIYPRLVGNDIGCGMNLYNPQIIFKEKYIDKWYNIIDKKLDIFDDEIKLLKQNLNIKNDNYDDQLGSIGGGNHFVELQKISEIKCHKTCDELNLKLDSVVIMAHSGSRAYGQAVVDRHKSALIYGTEDAQNYITEHNDAKNWAILNRKLISLKISRLLFDKDPDKILDISHNYVDYDEKFGWLHRKGAAPSDKGLIVIPGSRGDHSYILRPINVNDENNKNLLSVAHGAGRKQSRSDAYKKNNKKYGKNISALSETMHGSKVYCPDKRVLFEESPEAYKPINNIILDLDKYVEIVAILTPVLTVKSLL